MRLSSKVRLGLVALVTAASAVVLVPANANTGDFAVIVGGGNPSPGLTTTPTFQTF
ncbi:MAG: hypothetical protein QOC82_2187, partial [Frankiaceae bacterium]|nr:hypothetical protein [Frankiaceae bacterium]